MHYYSHNIGDFDRGTRHLTRLERSIYRDLIDLYYNTEQALCLDVTTLCRKIVARGDDERVAVIAVLDEFFHETPTGWFHDRCEEEIAEYRKTISQASAAGKASAAARAERRRLAMVSKPEQMSGFEPENSTTVERPLNDRSTDVGFPFNETSTDGQREGNEPPTNQEPITNNHKPRKSKSVAPASPLPDWIPKDAWDGYLAMRLRMKKPVVPEAYHLAVRKLQQLKDAGHDPREVLEQSTLNSWQGLFEIKPGSVPAAVGVKDWQ